MYFNKNKNKNYGHHSSKIFTIICKNRESLDIGVVGSMCSYNADAIDHFWTNEKERNQVASLNIEIIKKIENFT